MRNDLHRGTEVIAAAFLGDYALVDASRRVVRVTAAFGRAHETLVVSKVEVGFGAVVSDKHLAMLERAHRARVDVDVRVELDHADRQAASLEDGAQAGRRDALTE